MEEKYLTLFPVLNKKFDYSIKEQLTKNGWCEMPGLTKVTELINLISLCQVVTFKFLCELSVQSYIRARTQTKKE